MNDDPKGNKNIVLEKGEEQEKRWLNINSVTGKVLVNNERKDRWRDYFDELYNVVKQKEAIVKSIFLKV